ncbi:putative transcriptional acitvator, Baf family [Oleidesulfovibrio alaskensis G20]|jgi:type III pantothenate kinase|uniref:Type III pantothenate kinase n=1 Tax=Oleidesulfovibrio alaskensis (strain ATCC BAA-1058 / DSM 17464 / G20) TaxID=207559 RepID=COAX_OLEA2|nr:type III pantothenate kinase [Oleidesulfovibrio alaskensis]Q316Q1.1 RecName: Full=Type III pantothenate kinase; AltName: Full=PanK-III; AltName: Full=Pantothenic acid kinase [Oleidesulfovibrio alaskensis G20]ABB37095.1 putative transcriptional acitvator, Baf family [Oleidesulfovibrio alaskensis G20]MBG0772964.1 type III pantothenate kinase [Oleidesulfovibrio alaskensis]MBL3582904.1 type III pantothenate kinase [Oleidesulfovibrio alaskensis]
MPSVFLLFDIGNTNVKIGIADHDGVVASYVLPTDTHQTGDSLGLRLADVVRHAGFAPGDVTACVASSVVPSFNPLMRQACGRYFDRRLLLAPEDIAIPLENRYERPQEVGADRLVAAFAARRLWPAPRSIVSVDYGTATTFDCVQGEAYLGGLICPGVHSAAGALAAGTARLPRISLDVREDLPVVGRSTSMSLNHGFVFGFASMTEGLCHRLSAVLEAPMQVVATGGFASAIARVSNCFDHVRPDLLLEGLRILYMESGIKG